MKTILLILAALPAFGQGITGVPSSGPGSGSGNSTVCNASASATVPTCPGVPVPASLTGLTGTLVIQTTTSGAPTTINIAGLGAKNIYINGVISSATVYLVAGAYQFYYDGTQIQVQNGPVMDVTKNGCVLFSGATTAGSGALAFCVANVAGTATTLIWPIDSSSAASATVLTLGAVATCPTQLPLGYPSTCRFMTWTTRSFLCEPGLGDGTNAITAATYLQSGCFNEFGSTYTITGVWCFTDNAGTSTLSLTNGAGTALLTGAITCGSTFPGVAGTQSATTTIANADGIKFTFVADGTSKQTTWVIAGTR